MKRPNSSHESKKRINTNNCGTPTHIYSHLFFWQGKRYKLDISGHRNIQNILDNILVGIAFFIWQNLQHVQILLY